MREVGRLFYNLWEKMPIYGVRKMISCMGVVHKLHLQKEVGRWSKNINFYKLETVNEGDKWSKKPKTCQLVALPGASTWKIYKK